MNNSDKYNNEIKRILKKKLTKLSYKEIEKLLIFQKKIDKNLTNKKIIYIN